MYFSRFGHQRSVPMLLGLQSMLTSTTAMALAAFQSLRSGFQCFIMTNHVFLYVLRANAAQLCIVEGLILIHAAAAVRKASTVDEHAQNNTMYYNNVTKRYNPSSGHEGDLAKILECTDLRSLPSYHAAASGSRCQP